MREKIAPVPAFFDVTRNTILVNGRPVQVLALTHEQDTLTAVMPYMSAACHPCPVSNFWGRSARCPPECKPHDAIWYWHMDRFFVFRTYGFKVDTTQNAEQNVDTLSKNLALSSGLSGGCVSDTTKQSWEFLSEGPGFNFDTARKAEQKLDTLRKTIAFSSVFFRRPCFGYY